LQKNFGEKITGGKLRRTREGAVEKFAVEIFSAAVSNTP